jgi:hypothetical protein
VARSTFTRRFGRLSISALALVTLLTMASTITHSRGISKATSVEPQAKANARTLAASDLAAQETAQRGANGDDSNNPKSSAKQNSDRNKSAAAVRIEAAHGSFRLDTGSQGNRPYHLKTPYGALDVGG